MEDNYKFAALMHWIATSPSAVPDGTGSRTPRNDGCLLHPRHCEPKAWQSSAFSLIELLISLIIISLIISSFIPILTKKLKHKEVVLSSKSITSDCSKFDPLNRCQICDSTSCSLCSTQFNLSEGQYVDPKESCDVKQCPKNCAACDKEKCLKCKNNFDLVNGECKNESCIIIDKICVQKFNAGDEKGLKIPDGLVDIIYTPPSSVSEDDYLHTRAICWRGINTRSCDAKNGGYSGCSRTLCTWYAADKICKHHNLRLPTMSEMSSFHTYSRNKDANGLQLCDVSSSYDAVCADAPRCPSSYTGTCHPYHVWSKDTTDALHAYSYRLGGGAWNLSLTPTSHAFSVRCVADL